MMAAEAFMLSNGQTHMPFGMSSSQAISPMSQANPFESGMALSSFPIGSERNNGRPDADSVSAILMRKLPRNTSNEALRSMLLFAKDFVGADFIPTDFVEDKGYLSAVARFRTSTAAHEAMAMLDGKPNTANEARMIVEVLHLSPGGTLGPRRKTLETAKTRGATSSSSSTGSSNGQITRQSSRFNGTFQAMDRISPPTGAAGPTNPNIGASSEIPVSDSISSFQTFYSPQSPIGQSIGDRHRISGKSVIGEDAIDDETGELLKDPVAYAKNDLSGSMSQMSRRSTNPQLPTSRFAGLSLSTGNVTSPPMQGFASPRSAAPMQSPTSALSPSGMGSLGPNASYQMANQHYQRHNYPPVNPADQNPPCNTLYVGNLPIDTSEDELKAMFSKQRGYKRLCFRTKQNGPMCFVEFEDISFATKALNELYGHPLHNSVKGGIRLSFSKNPLGVRTGQPGGMGPPTPMSPQGPIPGISGLGGMQPFSTANGPPPGLAAPPGLSASVSSLGALSSPINSNSMMGGYFSGANVEMRSPPLTGGISTNTSSSQWGERNGSFSDYMLGR